jgi:hypothetical protein
MRDLNSFKDVGAHCFRVLMPFSCFNYKRAVEVARLLTRIQGLDQRINSLGIKRDRANCIWTQCENTLCFRTEFTL